MVGVLHPLPYDNQGFFKAVEDLPIHKIVPKSPIKAFTKAIFSKAAEGDVSGLYSNAR
jgi:hypothetical protein